MASPPPEVGTLIGQLAPQLSAVAIAMGRPAGAALVLPVFTRAQLGGPMRAAVAFALGLAAVPGISAELASSPVPAALLVLLGTKEVFVGLLIGVLLGVPIWSVQSAGELLDTQRSATQDQQSEPGSGNQNSTTATFLGITVIALFVISGGLIYVCRILARLAPGVSRLAHARSARVRTVDLLTERADGHDRPETSVEG